LSRFFHFFEIERLLAKQYPGGNLMRQFAWLELYKGMWYLVVDIASPSTCSSRIWIDKNVAITELEEEGWAVTGQYPNRLSQKLNLGSKYRGYGLIRTIH
jgi:hypothetical protein